ncbi:uncharacterized protein LOC127806565 isoform X2 [Diospyros lotus]|uniref:uncharacterized protein LOC127806565 isoform X2 n=1 Tax=Diospyros lotus TaxID=55363 RepID=UPI0022533DC6|nr:uncharacterized protein LOC127806565 isoform X2 [Diospyros lotus]
MKEARMGSVEFILIFFMLSFHFYSPLSMAESSPSAAHLKEDTSSTRGSGNGLGHRRSMAITTFSAKGGRPIGTGGPREGNHRTPSTGGAAVIPFYAAGAAGGHHGSHHGAAGSCRHSYLALLTLCAVVLASFLLQVVL